MRAAPSPHIENQEGTTAPKKSRGIPGRIGGVLRVLTTLITYARHLTATVATRVEVPEFATAAAVFGTYDLTTILFRVQRGLRRALALQQYLLERAARGHNLRFSWPPYLELQPHHRRPAKPPSTPRAAPRRASRLDPAVLDPDDLGASYMPSDEEFASGVRRRPVGRSINYILLDLAVVPGFCGNGFWMPLYNIYRRYGGSLSVLYEVREKREKAFQRERDKLPDTWHIDWRDLRDSTVRLALGYKIGEPPPVPVPS